MSYSHIIDINPEFSRIQTPKFVNDMILCNINRGFSEFNILVPVDAKTYPNIAVPVAGIIDYYRNQGNEFHFIYSDQKDYIHHIRLENPFSAEEFIDKLEMNYPFDKVWKFETSEGVNALVTSCIGFIRESDEMGKDMLSGIEWCLNETMDNVLQHSSTYGFFMGQLQKETKKLSICIFDSGIGIYNSLKNSKHRQSTPLDAITTAMKERVTRDDSIGQGNGMWGLVRIINENQGTIRISSAGAVYNNKGETVERGELNFGKEYGSTFIDFQLDYSKDIDIREALGGHKPQDLWLETRELSDEELVFKVSKESPGTGTRKAGEKFRNLLINVYKETRKKIIIDFEGVNVVSSSYADEVIGKLIVTFGFLLFLKVFTIKNVSGTNIDVINRSVEQRMAQKYYDNNIPEQDD